MFYIDKTWVFDQSECVQCPVYIIIIIISIISELNKEFPAI